MLDSKSNTDLYFEQEKLTKLSDVSGNKTFNITLEFFRNQTISVTDFDFDGNGAEIALFFAFSLLLVFLVLNKLNGRYLRLKAFLLHRRFHIISNLRWVYKCATFLKIINWVILPMPLYALGVWTAGLIVYEYRYLDIIPAGGVCAGCVCFALFFLTLTLFKLAWYNYEFDFANAVYFILTLLFLLGYQFVAIFFSPELSVFGYSAVFLFANFIVMAFTVFLNSAVSNGSIEDLIRLKIPPMADGRAKRDPNREEEFVKEINDEKTNAKYFPTHDDIYDIFTIGMPQFKKPYIATAFGPGFQGYFANLRTCSRRVITLFLWSCSAAILIVYSYVMKRDFTVERHLGFTTMFAVLTTDVILYLIFNAGIVKKAASLNLILFLNRLLLIIFGGDNWIYGYIALYIMYSTIISYSAVQIRFPFEDAVGNIDIDRVQDKSNQVDVAKSPELMLLVVTLIYLVILVILYLVQPEGVSLQDIPVGRRQLPFYLAAVFALIIVAAFYSSASVWRLYVRKQLKIISRVKYFLKDRYFDAYWMAALVQSLIIVVIGLISAWLTQSWSVCALIVFLDLFVLCYLNFYLYYILNDYHILQDIDSVNARVRKHNERLDQLKKDRDTLRQQLLSGNQSSVLGQDSMGMASKLIKQIKVLPSPSGKTPRNINKQLQEEEKTTIDQPPTNKGNLEMEKIGWNDVPAATKNSTQMSAASATTVQKEKVPLVKQSLSGSINKVAPAAQDASVKNANKQLSGSIKNVDNKKVISKTSKDIENMIDEELSKNNFEGGEQESISNANDMTLNNTRAGYNQLLQFQEMSAAPDDQQMTEDDPEVLRIDPDDEDEMELMSSKFRFVEIPDWKEEHLAFTAFFFLALRRNDYHIILSSLVGYGVLVLAGWIICNETKSYIGVTIFVPFVHYGLAFFSHIRAIRTDSPMTIFEHFCFFLAYLIQYGWGAYNLILTYHWNTNTFEQKKDAANYLLINLIVIPFITSVVAAVAKWLDNKGKLNAFIIFQFIIAFLQGAGMIAVAYFFMTWRQYTIIAVIVGILLFIIIEVRTYVVNDFSMPDCLFYFNISLAILAVVAAPCASFFIPNFPNFIGFSASCWLLAIFLFIYGYGRLVSMIANIHVKPVFFSPWVYPVMRFDPKKKDIIFENAPIYCIFIGYFLMIGWSVLATVWITPPHFGVGICILITSLFVITITYICQISHIQMHSLFNQIDMKIMTRAWLESKAAYIENRNSFNRAELVTFEEMNRKRDIFRNKLRQMQGRGRLSLEEIQDGVKFYTNPLKFENHDNLNFDQYHIDDPVRCGWLIYEFEDQLREIYRFEFELIIMFLILVLQHTETLSDQKKKYLFTFLNEKRSVLLALDIVINIPTQSSFKVQYARVITQIQSLTPEKQAVFNSLREQYIKERREIDEKRRQAAQQEEERAQARAAEMALRIQKKRDLAKSNEGKPIEEWADCWEKYVQLVEKSKKTGKKYEDAEFKPDDESLGLNKAKFNVQYWKRASETMDRKCHLYKGNVSHLDVVQGQLGDCYFLSAISVLGDTNVKAMIMTVEKDPAKALKEWESIGCFCVRFYRDGLEEYVVIDDFFPARTMQGKMEWAFVKGGALQDELWPMVLEKAYAKFYGSYSFIEAGKVQYALADMVSGFPEQMDLKTDAKNIDVFWEKLKNLHRQGALLGAGSPENALGDAAINQLGIVQGHAYAVLNVQEVDDSRIIQLRNPHGATGAEWRGDWSDTCPNWTQRAKSKIGYEPDDHIDGVFWMDVYDFIQQYSYLYICRILKDGPDQMWHKVQIDDKWEGKSAEGLPSRAYPNAKLELNPQYEITVYRPSDCFILLKQDSDPNSGSTFKGKQQIFFMISKNNGRRVFKVDKDLLVARSGNPINLNIVSSECQFDKSVSYPYKFTLMVANTNHGKAGEGEFTVTIYCTDHRMAVKPLQ